MYFVSHGGPNIMFQTAHPAYAQLQKIGREIAQTVKPSAVVVFSAHWQASSSGGKARIEVSDCVGGDLIYEFVPPKGGRTDGLMTATVTTDSRTNTTRCAILTPGLRRWRRRSLSCSETRGLRPIA